jgi:hypothetical protein
MPLSGPDRTISNAFSPTNRQDRFMASPLVSIVIPCRNEAENLPILLGEIRDCDGRARLRGDRGE